MSIFTTSSWFLLHVPVSSLICLNLGGTSHHIPICSSAPARLVQVVTFSSRALPEGQARGTGGVDTPGYPDTYLVLYVIKGLSWQNYEIESLVGFPLINQTRRAEKLWGSGSMLVLMSTGIFPVVAALPISMEPWDWCVDTWHSWNFIIISITNIMLKW